MEGELICLSAKPSSMRTALAIVSCWIFSFSGPKFRWKRGVCERDLTELCVTRIERYNLDRHLFSSFL